MEVLIVLVSLAVLVLQIMMIVKFFSLCSSVKALKERFCDYRTVDADTVRLAILTNSTDEVYKTIIEKTYRGLGITLAGTYINGEPNEVWAKRKIATASRLCAIMGRELPAEIRSVDAFRAFAARTDTKQP